MPPDGLIAIAWTVKAPLGRKLRGCVHRGQSSSRSHLVDTLVQIAVQLRKVDVVIGIYRQADQQRIQMETHAERGGRKRIYIVRIGARNTWLLPLTLLKSRCVFEEHKYSAPD